MRKVKVSVSSNIPFGIWFRRVVSSCRDTEPFLETSNILNTKCILSLSDPLFFHRNKLNDHLELELAESSRNLTCV